VKVDLAPPHLIGQALVEDAVLVDLAALQGVVMEAAEPLEVRRLLAVLGASQARSESTVDHGSSTTAGMISRSHLGHLRAKSRAERRGRTLAKVLQLPG